MDRKEQKKEAEKLYKKGRALKEISDKLEIPQGTVRRWKHEGNWDGERSKNDANVQQRKTNVHKGSRSDRKNAQEEKEIQITENTELTEKQRLFCKYFVKTFNATKSYQKAYGCTYGAAAVSAHDLLEKPKIKSEIKKLKNTRLNREMLEQEDIFQKYIDIAFMDITDFVEINHETQDIFIKSKEDIDGTLLSGIKRGKNGIEIKLPDRLKALEWLTAHMDMATEEQRARIAVLKKQAWQDIEEDETGIVEIAPVIED